MVDCRGLLVTGAGHHFGLVSTPHLTHFLSGCSPELVSPGVVGPLLSASSAVTPAMDPRAFLTAAAVAVPTVETRLLAPTLGPFTACP